MTLSVEDKSKCGPCGEQVCGIDQLTQDICTFADGTYVEGAVTIWDGAIYESLVNQACVPADEDQSLTWVDVKSPDSEKQWKRLGTIEDLLRTMGQGCPLTVATAVACMPISAGEWRCYDGCYRQAKVDLVLVENEDGSLNMPAAGEPANAQWSQCWTTEDLLNLLNDPKGIKAIDDSNPANTTVTLNDGTVFTSPEQADENDDTRLTNPRLNAAGNAYIWDIVDADGNVVGTENQPVAGIYTDCGGNDVANNKVVACANLGSDFAVNNNGLVSVNFQEVCIETRNVTDPCSEYEQLYLVTDTLGCAGFVTQDDISSFIAAFGPDVTGPGVQPVDPTNTSAMYYKTELENVISSGGTVDQAKLEHVDFPCEDVVIPCDGYYDVSIGNTLILDWDIQGAGSFILFIDGAAYENPVGNVSFFEEFTSVTPGYSSTKSIYFPAGTYNLCAYYVIADNGNAAQVVISNNQTRLRVERTITG